MGGRFHWSTGGPFGSCGECWSRCEGVVLGGHEGCDLDPCFARKTIVLNKKSDL